MTRTTMIYLSDQITDVIVLSLQQYFSEVKNAKMPYPWEKPWEFNSEKSQFDLFTAASLNQLIAAPKGLERQLEDTRHLKSCCLPKQN